MDGLYGELVCVGCREIISYPLDAISCRCQRCRTVNPAQHLQLNCPGCTRVLLVPINTIEALCPVCLTIIEIPIDMLPPVPRPACADKAEQMTKETMYVEAPVVDDSGRPATQTSIATQIA
jgi:LSD1 subclass zinc finger protein